jgi:hypothetical protein
VVYKVKVNRLLTDDREKILALVELALNQRKDAINIDIKEGAATVTVKKEFPKELLEILRKRVTSLLPHIRSVEFQAEKREAVAAEKKEEKTAKA